jgi:hypothetical protein
MLKRDNSSTIRRTVYKAYIELTFKHLKIMAESFHSSKHGKYVTNPNVRITLAFIIDIYQCFLLESKTLKWLVHWLLQYKYRNTFFIHFQQKSCSDKTLQQEDIRIISYWKFRKFVWCIKIWKCKIYSKHVSCCFFNFSLMLTPDIKWYKNAIFFTRYILSYLFQEFY